MYHSGDMMMYHWINVAEMINVKESINRASYLSEVALPINGRKIYERSMEHLPMKGTSKLDVAISWQNCEAG